MMLWTRQGHPSLETATQAMVLIGQSGIRGPVAMKFKPLPPAAQVRGAYVCETYVMSYQAHNAKLMEKVRCKTLKPMDFCMLYALQEYADIRTGRIHVGTLQLERDLGWVRSLVTRSIKRLRDEYLIAEGESYGCYFFMFNPDYFHVGGPELRDERMETFMSYLPKA